MNTTLVIGGTAVVSAAIGSAVTFFLVKKHYEEVTSFEIQSFKEDYKTYLEETFDSRVVAQTNEALKKEAMESANEIIADSGYSVEDLKEGMEQSRNVFDTASSVTQERVYLTVDESERDENPYVISKKEYIENTNYEVEVLTYFAGDDVLVGEDGRIIDDPDLLLGKDALNKFGYGSGDPRIVYIQNDGLESLYEVTYDHNTYASSQGFIEHSDKPGVRKFRATDY